MKIQGLKKYCDKESYLIEVFRNRNEIFKNIIGSNIKITHSEVRINNKHRVDLISESEEGILVFTEVSIRNNCIKDFITHRNQLIGILDYIGKDKFAQIILISPDFLNEDIKNIEELIAPYNVEVYFVYIPMDLILAVDDNINMTFKDKKNLICNKATVSKSIKITSKVINTSKKFSFAFNNEDCGNLISKSILKGLRQEIYWHLPVHRYKNLTKNIIRIGTGTSDIILNIYCNMSDKIRVELDFAERLNIFSIFKKYMSDMSNEIGNSININANKLQIYTEVPITNHQAQSIATAIDMVKKYIEYITKMYNQIQFK